MSKVSKRKEELFELGQNLTHKIEQVSELLDKKTTNGRNLIRKLLEEQSDIKTAIAVVIEFIGDEIIRVAKENGLMKGNQIFIPTNKQEGKNKTYLVLNSKGTRVQCRECTIEQAQKQLGAIIGTYRKK